MHNTIFAGLTELDPGDPITVDGGSFLQKNPSTTDLFLKVGAVTHKHDAHLALSDPVGFASGAVTVQSTPSGQIPANTSLFVAYTFTDRFGGETRHGGVASAITPGGIAPPSAAISATFDQSTGSLPVGQYTYAVTLNDGGGGESTIGPAVFIQRPPGYVNGRIILTGLAQELSSDPTQGWQSYNLWRTQDGSNFQVIATGQTADSFTDSGLICTDASRTPPSTMLAVQSNNSATFTLPDASHEPSLASAVAINVYISTDGSFTDPCLYAIYPTSAAGTTIVVYSLDLLPSSPPVVSRAISGANQIDPDTDILDWHWKRPVGHIYDLPSVGNGSGDVRVVLSTPPAIYIWDGVAWHLGGGGGAGGGLVLYDSFAASADASQAIQAFGDTVWGGQDSAMVTVAIAQEAPGIAELVVVGTRQSASATVGGSASSYRQMRFIAGAGVQIQVQQGEETLGAGRAVPYGFADVTISASGGSGGGASGTPGASGAPGPQGPAGSSAVFVASGGTGSAIVGPGIGFVGSGATQVQVSQVGGSAIVTVTTPTVAGAQGPAGASGANGAPGASGAPGTPGASGAAGPQGPAGSSAVFTASAGSASTTVGPFLGFAGSGGINAQLVQSGGSAVVLIAPSGSLQGPQGIQGPQGPQGLQGPPGTGGAGGVSVGVGGSGAVPLVSPISYLEFTASGAASAGVTDLGGGSARVSISVSGAVGPQGPAGASGAPGPQGAQGIQGPPGTDSSVAVSGSGGVVPVNPATDIEFAGSGGVGVAVQSLGGGSARVLIGPPPGGGGGGVVISASGVTTPTETTIVGSGSAGVRVVVEDDGGGVGKFTVGLPIRTMDTFTTPSLASGVASAGASAAVSWPLGKTSLLLQVQTDQPVRLRLYTTTAKRDADASRAVGTDPSPNSGCLIELVTTPSQLVYDLTPAVAAYSTQSASLGSLGSPTSSIPGSVQNLSGASGPINVHFVKYLLEA